MVHNGIEYAMMQGIAESYDFMGKVLKLTSHEVGEVFENWNQGVELLLNRDYGQGLKYKDRDTGNPCGTYFGSGRTEGVPDAGR